MGEKRSISEIMEHTVYIALGSNLEDRVANLRNAVMSMPPKVEPLECSPIYQTPPWGFEDQPPFLNQVIKAKTNLKPEGLLQFLKQLEVEIGRKRTFRFGPRLIDIDILFFDELIINSPDLKIPHPQMQYRGFVLVPLSDIAPDYSHPALRVTVKDLVSCVDADGIDWFSSGDCGKMEE
jgi:2-amino-4-hydroxy-6-hydroxymethyldihydropteridine diphosphokinase